MSRSIDHASCSSARYAPPTRAASLPAPPRPPPLAQPPPASITLRQSSASSSSSSIPACASHTRRPARVPARLARITRATASAYPRSIASLGSKSPRRVVASSASTTHRLARRECVPQPPWVPPWRLRRTSSSMVDGRRLTSPVRRRGQRSTHWASVSPKP